jgi:hypothetical protein
MVRRIRRRINDTFLFDAIQVTLKFTATLFTTLALPTLCDCNWSQGVCLEDAFTDTDTLVPETRLDFSFDFKRLGFLVMVMKLLITQFSQACDRPHFGVYFPALLI